MKKEKKQRKVRTLLHGKNDSQSKWKMRRKLSSSVGIRIFTCAFENQRASLRHEAAGARTAEGERTEEEER